MRPVSRRLGRVAISYSVFYLRRRYRRQIRLAAVSLAIAVAIGALLGARNVREG